MAQNDPAMQYQHMPRDQNIDSSASVRSLRPLSDNTLTSPQTPFHNHSLGQALGPHLAPPPPQYARSDPNAYRHPSTSPPTLAQPHAGPSGHQNIAFAAQQQQVTSPALKRKQMDPQMATPSSQAISKRRKDDDVDAFDDAGGQGAKHWTDDEKSKLFRWLMGPNSDDHWAALRATKNSCLRECADKVFDRKKSYQALKGCYERNFNLFKQIYALEQHHNHPGAMSSSTHTEADRLREYERRLQSARKNGCDVGNMTSRTIEHWFSRGWYDLFHRRWHGDPATTRPIQTRSSGGGGSAPQGGDDQDDDDPSYDMGGGSDPTTTMLINGMNGIPQHDRSQPPPPPPPPHHVSYINPQSLGRDVSQMPPTPQTATGAQVPMVTTPSMQHTPPGGVHSSNPPPPPPPNAHHQPQPHPHPHAQPGAPNPPGVPLPTGDPSAPAFLPLPFSPQSMNAVMQYLSSQTALNKMKMEYMRRREDREDKEHRTRLEQNRIQVEKDKLELEEKKQSVSIKQKSEKAMELLSRPEIDQSVRNSAAAYLRKIFED